MHTDPAWRQAATAACLSLGSYVQGLNTHRGMYAALSSALRAPGARAGPPETRAVGLSLARDFERYGVHLDAGGQARMARLTAEAQSLGYELGQNLVDPGALQGFDLPSSLAGMIVVGAKGVWFLFWEVPGWSLSEGPVLPVTSVSPAAPAEQCTLFPGLGSGVVRGLNLGALLAQAIECLKVTHLHLLPFLCALCQQMSPAPCPAVRGCWRAGARRSRWRRMTPA